MREVGSGRSQEVEIIVSYRLVVVLYAAQRKIPKKRVRENWDISPIDSYQRHQWHRDGLHLAHSAVRDIPHAISSIDPFL